MADGEADQLRFECQLSVWRRALDAALADVWAEVLRNNPSDGEPTQSDAA